VAGDARVGEYEIECELGAGAVGVVYRARSRDGRTVALKLLHPTLAADAEFRGRLAREFRIARGLRNAHLVAVIDTGESAGRPYLVCEYIGGGSLADRLRAGRLTIAEMLRLVANVAAGLEALHRQGLVHRDVKPANVMLRDDGSAALADFGLAKGAAYTPLTRPGQILGTLDYLAPELVRGAEATPSSDLYALGCVAFECLAGTPPFADRSLLGVGTAHLEDEPPHPPAPPEVAWALLRALEKEPARRPASPTMYSNLLRVSARG
jgi:serine/threonine-protein kinase